MKKNNLVNVLLLFVFLALIATIVFFTMRISDTKKADEATKVELKEVLYDSAVTPVSVNSEDMLISTFINGYNNSDGATVAQLMNLPATYIYSECKEESEFDKKYEEKMTGEIPADELILMQYSLKQEETMMINNINELKVQLTLIERSDFKDISKYLAKLTAQIRTVSEEDGIDEIDTLEFTLLKREGHYSIINYTMTETTPSE